MAENNNRCVICLNFVKVKIKVIARHSVDEQTLLTYLLRNLICTPISNDIFTEYLQFGNPSDWATLCHICEKQVKEALDIHKQILKMVRRINDIRKNIYEEHFYDSDDNENDIEQNNNVFFKLRESLVSDFRLKKWKTKGFQKTVNLKYSTVKIQTNQEGNNQHDEVTVKRERVSSMDDDNYSDSMMQEAVDAFFSNSSGVMDNRESVKLRSAIDVDNSSLTSNSSNFEDVYGDECAKTDSDCGDESPSDPPWRAKKRNQAKDDFRKRNKFVSGPVLPLESIPLSTKTCPLCGKTFINGSCMRRHYREAHLNSRGFQCPCCEEAFARKEYLQVHVLHKHPDHVTDVAKANNFKPYCQCPHCPSKFHIATALRRHIKRVHPAAGEEYSCDQCENKYKRKDSLISHKKFVHGDANDVDSNEPGASRRTCNICKKLFRSETIKRRHIRESHEKIKAFNCDLCPKVFARKSYLFRHIHNEHSLNKGQNPLCCKICSKECSGQAALSRHMQLIHKQRQNVKCKICSRSYTQVAALNIHVRFAHGSKSVTSADVGVNNDKNTEDGEDLAKLS